MEKVDILGCLVTHKMYGTGEVIEQTDKAVKILFTDGERPFIYPIAFEQHLQCEDASLQEKVLNLIVAIKEEKLRKLQEPLKTLVPSPQNKIKVITPRPQNKKKYKKENIAFKCNYCNGGQRDNGIGFICACSDEIIDYNIKVAHHNWCCDDEAPCKQCYDGIISREELDRLTQEDDFVCYESQMLRNWTAFAGLSLTKQNNQKPMKLNKVQINSLAILTTREPYAPEVDRFVFGVFLVDEAYEGDNREAGYVTTSSKYKLSLTMQEAKKVLFWNYYHNENAPRKAAWGQGLHRYISDLQAASMLKDILTLKNGTKDETLAKEFFEYFCNINGIDVDILPIKEGALNRK